MRDYIKRLLIAGIMALCISLLFLGGRQIQANTLDIEEATSQWVWPVNGVITDTYGTRNGNHKGIDIAGAAGSPVHAVDGGYVTKSYYSNSYGHVVFIKHANELETVYAHLQKRHVKEGQSVQKGQVIGEMGSTGDSSGSHLHFEVHKEEWTADKRNAVNPMLALEEVTQGETVQAMKEVEKTGQALIASSRMSAQEKQSVEQHTENLQSQKKNTNQEGTEIKPEPEPPLGEKVDKIAHLVQDGENLSVIAAQYHSSVKAIQQINQIQSEKIFPNQKLIIQPVNLYKYIVKSGDTLEGIAAKAGISVQELIDENGLESDLIRPGQELFYHVP